MLTIEIPGYQTLCLEHLVLDFNGVLALDGRLLAGVQERLHRLAAVLEIHVVTADTHGTARVALVGVPATLAILNPDGQEVAKRDLVAALGSDRTVCIGNGRNDRLMLKEAVLGVAVLQVEGLATEAAFASNLLVTRIHDALDLLLMPKRLIATLRS